MCGRYQIDLYEENTKMQAILREINRKSLTDLLTKGDVYPGNFAPIIHIDDKNNYTVSSMKWGFTSQKGILINARSETADTTYSFKHSIKNNRCLVPMNGFYEWKKIDEKNKTKYLFKDDNMPLMYLAGLYRQENEISVFTILTAEANEQIAPYHHRMPLTINDDSMKKQWLSKKIEYRHFLDKWSIPKYSILTQ